MSQARTWISDVESRSLFVFYDLLWEMIGRFVDIVGIVDHHCLNENVTAL